MAGERPAQLGTFIIYVNFCFRFRSQTKLYQHLTLRFALALLGRSKALSDGLQTALEEATRIRGEREHFRRHLKRTERTREQEQLLAQNQDKAWAARVAEIERECERKVGWIPATLLGVVSEVSSR